MRSLRLFASVAASSALLLSLASCSLRTRPQPHDPTLPADGAPAAQGPGEVQGPPESFGPPESAAQPQAQPAYGPEPRKSNAVVLVLGPGMAKGFAHAGVIRALRAAKIPIGAILGTEMGGLIGAIYAVDGNLNHFEWSLLRLKPEIFSANGGAILSKVFRERGSTEKLEDALRKILDKREIQASKIPLRVSVVDARSRKVEILDRGSLVTAAHGAVAAPGFFKPAKRDGGELVSADALRPFLVREAKGLNIGPVIAVDAGGGIRSPELDEADLVIRPDLGAMRSDDFSKRSEAAFQGKQALNASLLEIKKLLGAAK